MSTETVQMSPAVYESERRRLFVEELSDVCRKYGLGIEGGQVYVMENEDYPHNYIVDGDDKLIRY